MIETILEKNIAELSEDEKKYAVKKLEVFKMSEDWERIVADIEIEILHKIQEITKIQYDLNRDRTMKYSYLDKDCIVVSKMEKFRDSLGDSEGEMIFKKAIEQSIRIKKDQINISIEPQIEHPCFTDLDMMKLESLLIEGPKNWIQIAINQLSIQKQTNTDSLTDKDLE